ncbi:RNA polymerase sigma factor [Sorangium sp. So ce321]|uniref:RNA polymerase sigma factor n=1 Tax=Sorangium sp. So ce321 TaxID=3133300 RepID=UPI003F5E4357
MIVDRAIPISLPPDRVKRLVAYAGVPTRDLDDVVQEAMLRLWEKRELALSARNVIAWAESVVLNTARDHQRRARRRDAALTSLEEAGLVDRHLSPEARVIARQKVELAWMLIGQIDERFRATFIACEVLERSVEEVACEHQIPLETARTRLRLAREEFEEAVARWEAGQRWRGWDALRAVLFPPWLFERRSCRSDAGVGPWARGILAASATALGVLATGHVGHAEPIGRAMAGLSAAPAADAPDSARVARADEDGAAHAVDARAAVDGTAASAGPAPRAPARHARHHATGSGRERELVGRARTAIASGDVASLVEARRLLEEHGRSFPHGRMAAERDALLGQIR